ncbi:ssDNA-binding protein [Bosea lathyri]|uniref:Uncharacterized protein n=1 Tax=Bosea lathyri TaxID=1036778 RepID=A0A1H6BUG7_9HYPH|nr:ssDNA-binding protein [Bosea lathyri]SEG64344.1 Protein of unknown function [Bosea lathyri]
MAFARSDDFKSPDCRLSFANGLFKARAGSTEPGAKLKFGSTLIFPKSAMTAKTISYRGALVSLQDIVAAVIVEQWGDKGLEKAKAGLIKSPFLPGDGKEARNKKTGDLHGGMGPEVFFIRTQANADRPPVVSASHTAVIPATEKEVYSGCYGFGAINFFAWNHPQNGDGISCGIQSFYKKADGESLGGSGGDPEKWLETVEDTGAAPAATQGGAGASGLFG